MPRYRLVRFRRYQDPQRQAAEAVGEAVRGKPAADLSADAAYVQSPPRVTYEDIWYGEEHAALVAEPYRPEAEDFLPSPPRPPGPLDRRPSPADLRPALLCFLGFWIVSLHDWSEARGDGLWASGYAVFHRHENWRLFTALFAHADLGHLLSNTPLFMIFGWYLYSFFGVLVFPGAALAIGVLSNLATVAYYDPGNQLLGASGMLYGMVALWLVLYMRFETNLRIPVRFMRALAVSLILLFPTTFEPATSYMAHASGFAIGLAVGLLLWPVVRLRSPS